MPRRNSDGVWGERRKFSFSINVATPDEIERLLTKKFVGGFPVVFSSGRGALKLIVQEFWTKKEISIFQYASQCVVEAIQAAAVTPYSRTNFTSEIIYNQWGELDMGCKETPFIEDSCDTFLPVGSSVLQNGAQFEIWSLPKILHSRFGAIAWCGNNDHANALRSMRDASKRGVIRKQTLRNFRNFSRRNYEKWQTSEFKSYGLSKFEYGAVLKDVSEWGKIYDERQELIKKNCLLLNQRYSNYFEQREDSEFKPQKSLSPVLFLESKRAYLPDLASDTRIQVMHKIQSGKRPEKVMVYKFLHKGTFK